MLDISDVIDLELSAWLREAIQFAGSKVVEPRVWERSAEIYRPTGYAHARASTRS